MADLSSHMGAGMTPVLLRLAGFIGAGIAFGATWDRLRPRHAPDSPELRRGIGRVVLLFFLPCVVARALLTAPLGNETWGIPLVAAASTLAALGAAWLIYGLALRGRVPRPAAGAMLLASAWCNATYLGIPVVTALHGAELARVPVLFDLLALTPLLLTVGVLVGETYGERDPARPPLWLTVVRLPPLQVAALALGLNLLGVGARVPESVLAGLGWIAGLVGPLMLFSLGMALRPRGLRRVSETLPAAAIKLALAPWVAAWLAPRVGLTGEVAQVTILEASLPSMVLPLVIADRHRLDTDLLALAIALTTLVFLIGLGTGAIS